MTLRQDEFLKRLPKNGYNMAQTMREVGYSQQSSRAGSQYAILHKKIEKWYNPEQVKADILKAERDFAKDKDNSNRARMIELRAKITLPNKDQPIVTANIFQQYQNDLPIVAKEAEVIVEQPVDNPVSIDIPSTSTDINKLT